MMKKVFMLLLLGTGFVSYGQNAPKFKTDAEKEQWIKDNPEAYSNLLNISKSNSPQGKVEKTTKVNTSKEESTLEEQISVLKLKLEKNKNNPTFDKIAIENKIKALKSQLEKK